MRDEHVGPALALRAGVLLAFDVAPQVLQPEPHFDQGAALRVEQRLGPVSAGRGQMAQVVALDSAVDGRELRVTAGNRTGHVRHDVIVLLGGMVLFEVGYSAGHPIEAPQEARVAVGLERGQQCRVVKCEGLLHSS